jgi:hypothetical protein
MRHRIAIPIAVLASLAFASPAGAQHKPAKACLRHHHHVKCPKPHKAVPGTEPSSPAPTVVPSPAAVSAPSVAPAPPAEPSPEASEAAEAECPTLAQIEEVLAEHTPAEIAAGVTWEVECPNA